MTYWNTTQETQPELFQFRQKAADQDAWITAFFLRHRMHGYTPSEVWVQSGLEARHVPITSVRRSITNLTARGILRKTTERRSGPYMRSEFVWRVMPEPIRQAA